LVLQGEAEDANVIAEARRRFNAFLINPDTLPRDLRRMVFKIVMRNGAELEYNQMVHLYESATDAEDRVALLRSIGLSTDPVLIGRALVCSLYHIPIGIPRLTFNSCAQNYAISGKVRLQDVYILMSSCSSTPQGRELAFTFLKEHWTSYFSASLQASLLSSCVTAVCNRFDTQAKYTEVRDFLLSISNDELKRTIDHILENIKQTIEWKHLYKEDMEDWARRN